MVLHLFYASSSPAPEMGAMTCLSLSLSLSRKGKPREATVKNSSPGEEQV